MSKQPCEVLVSILKDSSDVFEAVEYCLRSIVDTLSFDCGIVSLIEDDRLKICHEYQTLAEKKPLLNVTLSPQESTEFIIRVMNIANSPEDLMKLCAVPGAVETALEDAQARGRLIELKNDTATIEKWQSYFNLCSTDYGSNSVMFLRKEASLLGFLSLQGREPRILDDAEKRVIEMAADAMSIVLFFDRRIKKLELKAGSL